MRRELADDWAKASRIDRVVMLRLADLSRARLSSQALLGSVQERRRIQEPAPPSEVFGYHQRFQLSHSRCVFDCFTHTGRVLPDGTVKVTHLGVMPLADGALCETGLTLLFGAATLADGRCPSARRMAEKGFSVRRSLPRV